MCMCMCSDNVMLMVVNELKISCCDDEMEGSVVHSTIIVMHVGLVHACAYLNTHRCTTVHVMMMSCYITNPLLGEA